MPDPMHTVDVGPPPDEARGVAVVAVAAPEPAAVPAPAPAPRRARKPQGRAPVIPLARGADPDPDIPFGPPLPPGALASLIEASDPEAAARMRAEDRAASGEPAPASVPVREAAAAMLADALPAIRRALAASDASASDVLAAVRALGQLANPETGAGDDGRVVVEIVRFADVQARDGAA